MRAATQDFCLPIQPLHLRLSLGLDHTQRAEASSLPWGLEDGLANSHPEGQPPRRPRPSPARDLESSGEPVRETPTTARLEQPLPLSWTREAVVGRAHPEGDQEQTLAPRGGPCSSCKQLMGWRAFPGQAGLLSCPPHACQRKKERERKWDSTCSWSPGPSSRREFKPLVSQRPGLQDHSPPLLLGMTLKLPTCGHAESGVARGDCVWPPCTLECLMNSPAVLGSKICFMTKLP